MIWMTFLIAGAVLKRRQGIAVTLVSDLLPPTGRKLVGVAVDAWCCCLPCCWSGFAGAGTSR